MIILKNYSAKKLNYVMKNQEVNIEMWKGPMGKKGDQTPAGQVKLRLAHSKAPLLLNQLLDIRVVDYRGFEMNIQS